MKSDLDFLNDILSAPARPPTTTTTTVTTCSSPTSSTASLDPNTPKDLASILASLQSLALQIPSEGEGEEDYSNADDEMIASLLAKMDQAEGAADGLEARLDSLLGKLDGLLGDLGEDGDDFKQGEKDHKNKESVVNENGINEKNKDEEKV